MRAAWDAQATRLYLVSYTVITVHTVTHSISSVIVLSFITQLLMSRVTSADLSEPAQQVMSPVRRVVYTDPYSYISRNRCALY
jgi:hypothetical protein